MHAHPGRLYGSRGPLEGTAALRTRQVNRSSLRAPGRPVGASGYLIAIGNIGPGDIIISTFYRLWNATGIRPPEGADGLARSLLCWSLGAIVVTESDLRPVRAATLCSVSRVPWPAWWLGVRRPCSSRGMRDEAVDNGVALLNPRDSVGAVSTLVDPIAGVFGFHAALAGHPVRGGVAA